MRFFEAELREAWVAELQSRSSGIPEAEAEALLDPIESDPRLRFVACETTDDVQTLANLLADGIDTIDLSNHGVQHPEQFRDAFVGRVVDWYLTTLDKTGVAVTDVYEGAVAPSTTDTVNSVASGDATHDDARSESSVAEAPSTDSKPNEQESTAARSPGATNTETSDTDNTERSDTDQTETSDTDDPHTDESLARDTLSAPASVEEDDADESDPGGSRWIDTRKLTEQVDPDHHFARRVLDRIDVPVGDSDLAWIKDHRTELSTLVQCDTRPERLIGGIGFVFLASEEPELVENYTDVIATLVDADSVVLSHTGLISFLEIAQYDTTALIGYIDTIWGSLDTSNDDVTLLALDVIERIARDDPRYVDSEIETITDRLAVSDARIRLNAGLVCFHLAEEQPWQFSEHVGEIVEQCQYSDQTGLVAARTLSRLSDDIPTALTPYVDTIISHLDADTPKRTVSLLSTLVSIADEGYHITNQIHPIAELTTADEENVRAYALRLLGYLAAHDPETVGSYASEFSTHLSGSSVIVAHACLQTCAALAGDHSTPLVGLVPQIVDYLDADDDPNRRAAMDALAGIVQDEPDAIIPELDGIVDQLDSEIEILRVGAAQILGHLSQEHPAAITPHLDSVQSLLTQTTEARIANPLIDALRYVAMHDGEAVVPFLDLLVDSLSPESRLSDCNYEPAVEAIAVISDAAPDAVAQHTSDLLSTLATVDGETETAIGYALAHACSANPETGTRHLNELLAQFENVDAGTRPHLATCLVSIAREHPQAITDHVDSIVDRLDAEAPKTTARLGWALVETNQELDDPELLETIIERLVDLVTHEDRDVQQPALAGLRAVAGDHPELVVPTLEDLVRYLGGASSTVEALSMDIIERVARDTPTALASYTDAIEAVLEENGTASKTRRDAILTLRHVAETDAYSLHDSTTQLAIHLTNDSPHVRAAAMIAIENLSTRTPESISTHASLIADRLTDERDEIVRGALMALKNVARESPAAVATHIDSVVEIVTTATDAERIHNALLIVGHAVQADSSALSDPQLEAVIETSRRTSIPDSDDDPSAIAVVVLEAVADQKPDRVAPYIQFLTEKADAEREFTRKKALLALYRLVPNHGEAIIPSLDDLAAQLDATDDVAARATMVFGRVSKHHPEAVLPYVDDVASVLSRLDEGQRLPVVDLLRNVAAVDAEAVEPYLSDLESLSPDDDTVETAIEEAISHIIGDEVETSGSAEYTEGNVTNLQASGLQTAAPSDREAVIAPEDVKNGNPESPAGIHGRSSN